MMIKRNIHKEKTINKGGWIYRLGGILTALLLISVVTACSSTGSAANTPTPVPTPTIEPPTPETALIKALQRFDDVQSFTVTGSGSTEPSDGDGWTSTSTEYIDQTNPTRLKEYGTTLDWDIQHTKLCMSSACYAADATGLLKPVNSTYITYSPEIESLDSSLSKIGDLNYTYVGENTIDGVRVFEYEIQITKEMIEIYKEEPDPNISYRILIEPYPVLTLYVNAEDGYLIRMVETYRATYDFADYYYDCELETDFSGWDTTTFTNPEYVDAQNADWQDYSGAYSSLVTFQFPKVYSLSESYGYPTLKTPSGSKMIFKAYANIASLSSLDGAERDQETGVAVCYGVAQLWLVPAYSGSPVIENTEWFNMNNVDFCKTVISSDDGQVVNYLFNEPVDFAWANGRTLPVTYLISITPVEGEDVNNVFTDVIQTIHFGGEE